MCLHGKEKQEKKSPKKPKYDPNRKWVIEVTEEQLREIIDSEEDTHRFLCGQTELWNTTAAIPENGRKVRDELDRIQYLVTPDLCDSLGNCHGASYDWAGNGITDPHLKRKVQLGYAIYRNLKHCMEKFYDRDGYSVYKGETLTCGVPLAICYPKEEEK